MHGMKSERKGHTYYYFGCSKKCGVPSVRMEEVDKAAVKYLHELLNEDNQKKIADAMRAYKGGERERLDMYAKIKLSQIWHK